jgi:SpoVK/Ycf46/Vps4 family AAA+-type ATPase
LCNKTNSKGLIQIVYELNGPVRMSPENKSKLKEAWIKWRTGEDSCSLLLRELRKPTKNGEKSTVEKISEDFEENVTESIGNPNLALEFLRQLTICSRKVMNENLLIIIEAADMLLPCGSGDIATLNDRQLQRISIVSDWLGDPEFNNGHDTVLFIAESRSLIHPRVAKLPQILSVEIHAPDTADRKEFLLSSGLLGPRENLDDNQQKELDKIAELTASLSICALQQLVKGAVDGKLSNEDIVDKVEDFIQAQLGEDVIEFKKPTHTLDDCIGFTKLKAFLRDTLIPRMQLKGEGILSGAAVAGPIGGGKTHIFEAVASELNMPVLVLKGIRSQWFGQTDVIFERLKRVLEALDSVLIFVDEADTQFGSLGEGTHETERRLTGKIQGLMSDPKFKGKVYWLLMTARIHLLSPDIRRPGRVGDLIVPVLDPQGDDRKAFLKWALKDVKVQIQDGPVDIDKQLDWLVEYILPKLPEDYSSASFASLKSNLAYKKTFRNKDYLLEEINDFIQPAISQTRKYQTLQALANCTRRSLLPNPDITDEGRQKWELQIRELEARGIK